MKAQISPRASRIVQAVKSKYGPGLALFFSREVQVSLIRAEAWLVLTELEAERVLLG